VYLSQMAVVAVAALAMTAEYDTMLVRTTLAACPRRLTVLAAKAAVVIAVVLPAGAVSVLGSLAAGRGILAGTSHPQLSLADGPVLRAFGGTVLYLGLIALLSLGVAAMVRHTGGAISLVLGLLFVLPIAAQFVSSPWSGRILKYSPMTAGLAIQATKHVERLPIGPWPGLGVLAAYATAAAIGGAVLFRRRDA
jgi:ABC-2 type transport system permease protein